MYLRPFLISSYFLLDAGTIISFWGCTIFSECVYLFGSFLIYFSFFSLSLSLIFFTLLVVLFVSASETNRLGFTEFLLKIKGGGGEVCTERGGEGD